MPPRKVQEQMSLVPPPLGNSFRNRVAVSQVCPEVQGTHYQYQVKAIPPERIEQFCEKHGLTGIEVFYVSGYAMMINDKKGRREILAESGYDDEDIAMQDEFRELGEEYQCNFRSYYVFGEATPLYEQATTEAGKRLAYSQTSKSRRHDIPPHLFDSFCCGTRSHPEAIEFGIADDVDDGDRIRRQTQTEDLVDGSGDFEFGGGEIVPNSQIVPVGGDGSVTFEGDESTPRPPPPTESEFIDPSVLGSGSGDNSTTALARGVVPVIENPLKRMGTDGSQWCQMPVPAYVHELHGAAYTSSLHLKVTVHRLKRDSIRDLVQALGMEGEEDLEDLVPQSTVVQVPPGTVVDPLDRDPKAIKFPLTTIATCSLIAIKKLFDFFPAGPIEDFTGFGLLVLDPKSNARDLIVEFVGDIVPEGEFIPWVHRWELDVARKLPCTPMGLCSIDVIITGHHKGRLNRAADTYGTADGLVNLPMEAWVRRPIPEKIDSTTEGSDEFKMRGSVVSSGWGSVKSAEKRKRGRKGGEREVPIIVAHRNPFRASKEIPADLAEIPTTTIPAPNLLRAALMGFLYENPFLRGAGEYMYRVQCTNVGGGLLSEVIGLVEFQVGDRCFFIGGCCNRFHNWPRLKVLVEDGDKWSIRTVTNPYLNQPLPAISREIINEATADCMQIVIAEISSSNRSYRVLYKKGSGGSKGSSNKMKDDSIAKSAKTDSRRFRQSFWSHVKWVLTEEEARLWISSNIDFLVVSNAGWKDRPHDWVVVMEGLERTVAASIDPPDDTGLVMVRKEHPVWARSTKIGFGLGTWKDIFVAMDPHFLPPAKGRVDGFLDGDLLVEVQGNDFVEMFKVYGSLTGPGGNEGDDD